MIFETLSVNIITVEYNWYIIFICLLCNHISPRKTLLLLYYSIYLIYIKFIMIVSYIIYLVELVTEYLGPCSNLLTISVGCS